MSDRKYLLTSDKQFILGCKIGTLWYKFNTFIMSQISNQDRVYAMQLYFSTTEMQLNGNFERDFSKNPGKMFLIF